MIGPSRPLPRVGGSARIKHFGGSVEWGIVVAIHEEGARVSVEGEDGELYEFVLSPASARFVSAGDAHGPRLKLLEMTREREMEAVWESERLATLADVRSPDAREDARLWEATLDDRID